MLTVFLVTLFFKKISSQTDYFVDGRENYNNVWGAVDAGQSSSYVEFLGLFDNTKDCMNACIQKSTEKNQCTSYTYHLSPYNGDYNKNCFARFGNNSLWTPVPNDNINCGRIIWSCKNDIDCSLNGKCNLNTGNCTCRTAWTGYKCNTLNLLPASYNTGYNVTDNNRKTSSWGGDILIDPNSNDDKTKYHMYLAEMDNHCGINAWVPNSRVTHAQSTDGINGPFERVDIVHQHFAHEPNAVFGPNGELVLYYTWFNYSSNITECVCQDGSTPPTCNAVNPDNYGFYSSVSYSTKGMSGPWSTPSIIFPERNPYWYSDTNLAGVITSKGEFIGMSRQWIEVGSTMHLCTSTDWKDGSKYIQHDPRLFPQLIPDLSEDQFIYTDCNGNYHAIFHNMSPPDLSVSGAHAFSVNGFNWTFVGVSYDNIVEFDDGSSVVYDRRERPHIVFDDDGCTPIALTNGADYGGRYGDATFTLLQPIKH